jgi:O-antigen/teichoic acid export membrane protein
MPDQSRPAHQRLPRNAALNLLGQGLPLIAGLVTIPLLIDALGTARFGILALGWSIVGYFSLFDLGFSRAMTHMISRALASGGGSETSRIFGTGLTCMALFGILLGASGVLITPWLTGTLFQIDTDLQQEARHAFYVLALSIPVVVLCTGFVAPLEAKQRFDLILLVRVPLGIINFVGPLLAVYWRNDLVLVILVLLFARLAALLAYGYLLGRVLPDQSPWPGFDASLVPKLFQFGAWMTVANIVAPIMLYSDRLMIASMLSMAAVAYYATPFDIVYRLAIIPNAIVGVLFPAFSALHKSNRDEARRLFWRGSKATFLIMFTLVLPIVVLAEDLLTLWLGSEFARESTIVLQLIAIAMLINGTARVGTSFIQGSGRPDVSARLLLLQLPAYLALLWLFLDRFGLAGAALAWLVRSCVDMGAVFWYTQRFLGDPVARLLPKVLSVTVAVALLILAGISLDGTLMRAFYATGSLVATWLLAWHVLLNETEKRFLQRLTSRLTGRRSVLTDD